MSEEPSKSEFPTISLTPEIAPSVVSHNLLGCIVSRRDNHVFHWPFDIESEGRIFAVWLEPERYTNKVTLKFAIMNEKRVIGIVDATTVRLGTYIAESVELPPSD